MQMSNLPRATDSELSQEDQQLLEIGKIHKKAIPVFEFVTSTKPGNIVAVACLYGDAIGHVPFVTGSRTTIGAGSEDGSHSTGWSWNGVSPKENQIYRR